MDASSSTTPSWVITASLAAVTLQLLRWAMDLVQVASQGTTAETTTPKPSSHFLSNEDKPFKSTSSLSMESTDKKKPPTYGSISINNDEEGQPLFPDDSELDEETVRCNARASMFLASWSLLTILFLITAVWLPTIVPTCLVMASAAVCCLQVGLLLRDVREVRYGVLQRFFHGTSVVILWTVTAVHMTQHAGDWVVLTLLTASVLLTVLAGWFPVSAARQVMATEGEPTKGLDRAALKTLLKPYFWPDATTTPTAHSCFVNRLRAIATWVCVILAKTCGLVSPLLLGWATTALAHQDYASTIRYSIGYAVISLLGTTFKEGQSLVYLKVAQAAFVQLSEAAFGHLHNLSLDWHLRKKLGEVLRSMTRGIAACDMLMKYLFLWLLPAMVECSVVCLIFATYFHYWPLAVTVFYFVFVYVLWTILVTLWRKKFRKALVQSDNAWNDLFTDSLINFETVKFFTAEDYEKRRFGEAVNTYQAGSVDVQASLSFLNISQQVILQCCLATSLSLAVLGIRQRIVCCMETMGCESGISDCCQAVSTAVCPGMQVGDFVAVLTYTLNLFAPLNFLGSVYNAIVMAIIDLTNLSELLAEHPDVLDAPDAIPLPLVNTVEPDVAVEFDNVTFHYPTQGDDKGLHHVSFKMKRGTTTAIVGPTGAGKTTISRLLFRFYDVLGGAVKVNGMDVRSVTQKSLREAIGVVPQSASMFNDTIRSNLLYGRLDATQEELEQAARDAQLLDFVESLEDGWETTVGDRGLKLSGGEKQRAAIARCLLKNPPFVLLDEATSALDSLTESSVQEALDRLGKERTVLVIAHRLGTIRNANNIVVLKDGRVCEEGTHDQLLRKNGVYAEMWNMQLHTVPSKVSLLSEIDTDYEFSDATASVDYDPIRK